MQDEKYTDLDLKFREMFQDAEEEVPSQLWESLSGELDRRARRKVVALRWRHAAAGIAAAAAVVSGIFILSDRTALNQPVQQVTVAEAQPATGLEQDVPSIEEQLGASSQLFMADVPEPAAKPGSVFRPSEISEPMEAGTPAETAHPVVSEPETADVIVFSPAPEAAPVQEAPVTVTTSDEQWSDPFAGLEDEKVRGSHDVSLFLSGNVMSNDASGNGAKTHRAPSIGPAQKTGVAEKSSSTYGIPLSLGFGANIALNDKWSVGTGLNWSLLSRSFTGIYTEVGGNGSVMKSINTDINNEIHYIGIPLNLYYNVLSSRGLKFYAWGGASAEKGLVNKYRIHCEPDDIFFKESVSGIQWSAGLGLGLEFSINDFVGLYIDPSARYYFDCDQPNSVRTQKPYMLNFEAGLRFNL